MIDQAIKEAKNSDFYTKLLGTFLIVLSGAILFSDKLVEFSITNTFGFKDTQTFVWVLSQSLSPIILCLGGILKPYKIFYSAPLYLYFIQVFWVFNPSYKMDDPLLHVYATGFSVSTFLFLTLTIFLLRLAKKNSKRLLYNIRQMSSFILLDVRNKYVAQESKKDFAKDVIDLNNSLK